jgi:hypothetical protein
LGFLGGKISYAKSKKHIFPQDIKDLKLLALIFIVAFTV